MAFENLGVILVNPNPRRIKVTRKRNRDDELIPENSFNSRRSRSLYPDSRFHPTSAHFLP